MVFPQQRSEAPAITHPLLCYLCDSVLPALTRHSNVIQQLQKHLHIFLHLLSSVYRMLYAPCLSLNQLDQISDFIIAVIRYESHACCVCHMHVTCMLCVCHMHVTCMLCVSHACHMHAVCVSHACHMHAVCVTCMSHACCVCVTCMSHACCVCHMYVTVSTYVIYVCHAYIYVSHGYRVCHMVITWVSHGYHMGITWVSCMCHYHALLST